MLTLPVLLHQIIHPLPIPRPLDQILRPMRTFLHNHFRLFTLFHRNQLKQKNIISGAYPLSPSRGERVFYLLGGPL